MYVAKPCLLHRALACAGFALVLGLSWPGVEARAEGDIAPSARDLTALNPRVAPVPATPGAACRANTPIVDPQRAAAQRETMQRLAQAMKSEGLVVMNNRGSSYEAERDPTLELMRIQLEARAAGPRD